MRSFRKLNATISDKIKWNQKERNGFEQQIFLKKYRAGDVLADENEICDRLFFINKGILCNISKIENPSPIVTRFAFENHLITDFVSFNTGRPSMSAIQALEDTECVVIPRSAVEWFYNNVGEGEKLGRIIFERFYYLLCKISRLQYVKAPAERYKLMTELFPEVESRVSQRYRSFFLKIDPAYFTRLNLAGRA